MELTEKLTRQRRDESDIKADILKAMIGIQRLFDYRIMIDGSKLNQFLKETRLSNDYKTRIRARMLNKNSHKDALRRNHIPGDGKRGVYYTLKRKSPPTPELATEVYLNKTSLTQNCYRKITAMMKENIIAHYERNGNRLTILFEER